MATGGGHVSTQTTPIDLRLEDMPTRTQGLRRGGARRLRTSFQKAQVDRNCRTRTTTAISSNVPRENKVQPPSNSLSKIINNSIRHL